MSCANANVPPAFTRDPVLPVLSVKSPFNLYHATKFVESVVNVKPPSGPVDPALHVQAATDVLEIGELELLGHARHVAASVAAVVVEYVPVGQLVHTAVRMKTLAPMRVFKMLGIYWYEFCAYKYWSLLASKWLTTDIQGSSAILDL